MTDQQIKDAIAAGIKAGIDSHKAEDRPKTMAGRMYKGMNWWKQSLTVIISLSIAVASIWKFGVYVYETFNHEKIAEYNRVVETVDEVEALKIHLSAVVMEMAIAKDTMAKRTEQFNATAQDIYHKIQTMHRDGAEFHAVGYRADTSGKLYYRDRLGEVYLVHPDTPTLENYYSPWFYFDRRHRKHSPFQEL